MSGNASVRGFDPTRPVYVEAESRKVGNLPACPRAFDGQIGIGDCCFIDPAWRPASIPASGHMTISPEQPDPNRQRLMPPARAAKPARRCQSLAATGRKPANGRNWSRIAGPALRPALPALAGTQLHRADPDSHATPPTTFLPGVGINWPAPSFRDVKRTPPDASPVWAVDATPRRSRAHAARPATDLPQPRPVGREESARWVLP